MGSHVHGDRILETTVHTGSGSPVTLAGAVSGYRTFSTLVNVADTFYYTMRMGTQWEVGFGTLVSATTFNRTEVIASSNAGAPVSFTGGTKEVWMDIPARLLQMFTPSPNPALINGNLVGAAAAGAYTISVKTLAGANPSAADPVFFVFPDNGWTTQIRVVTSALSIVIPSGATLGVTAACCPRIWIAAMDFAGVVELVVRNCYDDVNHNISWFPTAPGFMSTTAIGAGADNAHESYSVSSRSNLSFAVLGYITWDTSLATPGTWVTESRSIAFSPMSPKPGDVIQKKTAFIDSSVFADLNSVITNTDVQVQLTPTSFANPVRVTVFGGAIKIQNTLSDVAMWLWNFTAGQIVGAGFPYELSVPSGAVTIVPGPTIIGMDKPRSQSVQTYMVQFYDVATAGTTAEYVYGGYEAVITAEEIMI